MTSPVRTAGRRGATFSSDGAHLPKFGAFFDAAALPKPPPSFGHYHDLGALGMLGNDKTSDCVEALAAHRVQYWLAPRGIKPEFTAASVIKTYTEWTDYRWWKPFSDRGTDKATFPELWMKYGVLDAAGNRHRCDAFVTLELGNWDQFVLAMWLFDGVDIGVALPADAERLFQQGRPWTGIYHGPQGDGHGIAGYGINSAGMLVAATWGDLQAIDRLWWHEYVVWLDCTFSMEALDAKGLSPEGFDRRGLESYMARFR